MPIKCPFITVRNNNKVVNVKSISYEIRKNAYLIILVNYLIYATKSIDIKWCNIITIQSNRWPCQSFDKIDQLKFNNLYYIKITFTLLNLLLILIEVSSCICIQLNGLSYSYFELNKFDVKVNS